jgi:hypothetical protein
MLKTNAKTTNTERKSEYWNRIKAQRELSQASIDTCKEKRADNRRKSQELAEALEKLRLQRLANLRKKMVIMFAEINGRIVILTIIDVELLKSDYSARTKNYHITYGSSNYEELNMIVSYTRRGKRLDKSDCRAYTVSTDDGVNFKIFDTDGKLVFSFETLIQYETLAGTSVSGVKFDQFFYDPFKGSFDDETGKFDAELDKMIEADADHVSKTPDILDEGYIPYFRLGF